MLKSLEGHPGMLCVDSERQRQASQRSSNVLSQEKEDYSQM